MPRKKSQTLTDAELRIMEVLWEQNEASVRQITDTLSTSQPLAYTTVLTMMRILTEKGYVAYRKQGRAFIYHALIARTQARAGIMSLFLKRFYNGSPKLLVQNLIDEEVLTSSELDEIKQQIDSARQEDQQ